MIVRGAPLMEIIPSRIDGLLRPSDRVALRSAAGELDYAALDGKVNRLATALRALVDGPNVVIALAMVLEPAFAVSFFSIARSGGISALVNPLLPTDRLVHVLSSCGARVAIVPSEMRERLKPVWDRLPELQHLILTTELDELAGSEPVPELDQDWEAVACLQFTSGTTGAPKVVQLTHRNLVVNAAQTVQGHQLSAHSVLFNYLPTFHLMHLTISVTVGATLVLCTDEDVADAVDHANRVQATHFYSLPVRLSWLAADPRLTRLEAPALRAILSGGSALPAAAATMLSQHFGVPVVQGYGLAETSPSTHLGNLDRPKAGSSGIPVPGTECRIVDVDTGAELPAGKKGEIQVRGPQLMRGYLGRDLSQDVDAEGWFATGDVGLVDTDGYLFVVDRIKDVFKCDNWLVSPTEIERVLLCHPGVRDCVVLDYPDEFHGAVAYGLVVARHDMVGSADLAEFVNARVPHYEQVKRIDLVAGIPRSPTGKVQRRELREQVLARQQDSQGNRRRAVFNLINKLTVTGDIEEFERLITEFIEHLTTQPGFRSHRLYQATRDPKVYYEVLEWNGEAAHKQATAGKGFTDRVQGVLKHADADADFFVLRSEHRAA